MFRRGLVRPDFGEPDSDTEFEPAKLSFFSWLANYQGHIRLFTLEPLVLKEGRVRFLRCS